MHGHFLHTPLPIATSTEMGSDQSAVRSWQGSDLTADWSLPILVLVWVRSFIEPDLFENSLPFDNTTSIYLICLIYAWAFPAHTAAYRNKYRNGKLGN